MAGKTRLTRTFIARLRLLLMSAAATALVTTSAGADDAARSNLACGADEICASADEVSQASPVLILRRVEPQVPAVTFARTLRPQAPSVTIARTISPAPVAPDVAISRTITPILSEPPVPVIDEAAIAARDAAMLDALTRQSIALITAPGLDNDGETTRAERDAAEALYAERGHAPLFVSGGQLNARGDAVLTLFKTAEVYGLDPADFDHAAFLASDEIARNARAAAEADIAMTLWTLRYARHAMTGRINPSSIASDITLERNLLDPATVMPALLASGDPQTTLLGYHPPHAQFHALREELAKRRDDDFRQRYDLIAEGGTLRLGDIDGRVQQLRARLGLPDPMMTASIDTAHVTLVSAAPEPRTQRDDAAVPLPPDPNLFDETLDQAVRRFQEEHNLTADGIVGPATFAALNAQAGDLVPDIIANMERWRWMPRDLGDFHVIANVPEYRLWVRRNGEAIFTTRTVVGRNQNRTAIFSDEMEYMAVNPFWNVPASIARGEILPRVLENPGYLASRNYEVLFNGRSVDPFAVDWQAAAQSGMPRIRQRPGAGNALGQIKFMFPNQHAIYFHDTPSRSLFGRDQRAFSHGCVRVQDPWAFAEALLTNEPDWDLARAQSLRGPRERNIMLDTHIPVHITYFTARIADDGRLIMARDLYGHHARTVRALGLDAS